MFCYLAKLNAYLIILGNRWLQTYNLAINGKQYTMKFNSADCMENRYMLYCVLCIKFAVRNGLKNTMRSENPLVIDSKIDIQPVSAKHFFLMV